MSATEKGRVADRVWHAGLALARRGRRQDWFGTRCFEEALSDDGATLELHLTAQLVGGAVCANHTLRFSPPSVHRLARAIFKLALFACAGSAAYEGGVTSKQARLRVRARLGVWANRRRRIGRGPQVREAFHEAAYEVQEAAGQLEPRADGGDSGRASGSVEAVDEEDDDDEAEDAGDDDEEEEDAGDE